MSWSSTDIFKGLAVGLLAVVVSLLAGAPHANATRFDTAATELTRQYVDALRPSASLCKHKLPQKHRCLPTPRVTTALLDPGAKRKGSEPLAVVEPPRLLKQIGAHGANAWAASAHLHLSFDAVYATTRRMHI